MARRVNKEKENLILSAYTDSLGVISRAMDILEERYLLSIGRTPVYRVWTNFGLGLFKETDYSKIKTRQIYETEKKLVKNRGEYKIDPELMTLKMRDELEDFFPGYTLDFQTTINLLKRNRIPYIKDPRKKGPRKIPMIRKHLQRRSGIKPIAKYKGYLDPAAIGGR